MYIEHSYLYGPHYETNVMIDAKGKRRTYCPVCGQQYVIGEFGPENLKPSERCGHYSHLAWHCDKQLLIAYWYNR
jgi:hypothetical protein